MLALAQKTGHDRPRVLKGCLYFTTGCTSYNHSCTTRYTTVKCHLRTSTWKCCWRCSTPVQYSQFAQLWYGKKGL